jgi:C-terminal processing protease CtpA/Prc
MPLVEAATSEEELLDIMGKSIDYLKDGHVWIDTKFNHRGCYTFYYDENNVRYPENFIKGLISNKVLDYSYRTRNGHVYGNITRDGKKFFYLHHDDFSKDLTAEDLEMFKPHIENADGIIYDIRTNPGGNSQLAIDIAGRFVKEKTLVGYDVVKTGKGHNDFSEPVALYIVPVDKENNWADIKTTVLTNRDVYSTANMFASFMKQVPNATLIGGKSGGGGGSPTSFYLPNGWTIAMSAHRLTLDVNKAHIEEGVDPDILVTITDTDIANNVDSILEKAIEVLSK